MSILAQPLDYTDKDFDSVRARLYNVIGSAFPKWKETEVANFGNILLESFGFVGDVLFKYQDNQAIESRWSQATQRRSLINLAKLIGYEPAGATASQVDVAISIDGGAIANDVPIDIDTVVRTSKVGDLVRFRLLAPATIPAGDTEVTVTAENSEAQTDTFVSSGIASQEIKLTSNPYLDGSIVLTAANGDFVEVDNFLDSTASDRHFTVIVDQDDRATIRFGNGTNGALPTGNILVDYRVGGGASGVVDEGTVTVIEGFFTDDLGNAVTLNVTNPNSSTDAFDRESRAEIRVNAPLSLRTLTRTVTRDDFEINALRVPGVARALMLTSDEDPAVQENTGTLFVVPEGGGTPTQALLDAVEEMVTVTYPKTLTFEVFVLPPLYKAINVSTVVYLRAGENAEAVKARIVGNLTESFTIANTGEEDDTADFIADFGFRFVESSGDPEGLLPWSDIFNIVRDSAGVRKIADGNDGLLLNGSREDVEILLREFPTLGTVTVINGETGTEIP